MNEKKPKIQMHRSTCFYDPMISYLYIYMRAYCLITLNTIQ